MVTEGSSGIIMPEQPASLQFRHDTFNKDVEGAWERCRQDHKSIRRLGDKPLFQDIRNLCRGTTYGPVPSRRCCNIIEVSKCHVFATRTIQQGLREALPKIGLWQFWDRTVQVIA